jgi:hypothetical protein
MKSVLASMTLLTLLVAPSSAFGEGSTTTYRFLGPWKILSLLKSGEAGWSLVVKGRRVSCRVHGAPLEVLSLLFDRLRPAEAGSASFVRCVGKLEGPTNVVDLRKPEHTFEAGLERP